MLYIYGRAANVGNSQYLRRLLTRRSDYSRPDHHHRTHQPYPGLFVTFLLSSNILPTKNKEQKPTALYVPTELQELEPLLQNASPKKNLYFNASSTASGHIISVLYQRQRWFQVSTFGFINSQFPSEGSCRSTENICSQPLHETSQVSN